MQKRKMPEDDVMRTEIYTEQVGEMEVKGTQKLLNIIFIVDVSGSMQGNRIEAVNQAFTRMIPELRQIQMDAESEFILRISIMTFDKEARWIVSPTPIMEYNHDDITCSQYATYYSKAFDELNQKLSSKWIMDFPGKKASPYIMFMTDGYPTSNDCYQDSLQRLNENGWFNASQRYAVLIGTQAINSAEARAAVEEFVSNTSEGIIDAADAVTIASAVQARTVVTVANMTRHKIENVEEEQGGFEGVSGDINDYTSNDDPFASLDFDQIDNFDSNSFI